MDRKTPLFALALALLSGPAALAATGVLVPIANASSGRDIIVPIPTASATISPFRNHPTDWPKYCANLEMTGVPNNETRITTSSAALLKLIWTRFLQGATALQPTVVGNVVYMGDWAGNETAYDVATGTPLAQTNLGKIYQGQCNPAHLGITSSAAVGSGMLFVAGGDDYFYALDATSLETVWKTKLGDETKGYYGWCSPALLPDKVIQGISSNCDDPFVNGYVVSLDPVAGAIGPKADLSRTTDPGHYGAGVWTSPAIDLAAGNIFVTTASAYHYGDGDAYSILRIRLADLTIEDRWKITPADYAAVTDPDWGSSPTLFTDASSRLLVGGGQKDGNYYAFLRADLNRGGLGPVWKTPIASSGACPQCSQGTLSTASFDGSRLYVGGGNPPPGSGSTGGGTVVALDPSTGQILWRYPTANDSPMTGPVIAPISSANGVVFAAGGNTVLALDAATGSPIKVITLNVTRTNAGLYGGIAISDGRIFFGDTDGNLYCYGVPR